MWKCLTILAMVLASINAYNILVLTPYPIVGHWLYVEEFIKELLSRGHKVTAVTSYNVRRGHENYTSYLVPAYNIQQFCKTLHSSFAWTKRLNSVADPAKDIFVGSFVAETQNIWMNWKIGLLNSEHVLKNAKVQELIKNKEKTFDLVFADQFNQESLYLFAHKYKCPLVTLGNCLRLIVVSNIVNPIRFRTSRIHQRNGPRHGFAHTSFLRSSSGSAVYWGHDFPSKGLQRFSIGLRCTFVAIQLHARSK